MPFSSLLRRLDRFFFAEVSAAGFGLMRIAWAATVLLFLIGGASDVVRYYSEAGIMPNNLSHLVFRSAYRFTLLDYITTPAGVVALWSFFVACLLLMMAGVRSKLMTIICVLLLFSFQERNLQPLGGGDTVLRVLGFFLLIAPEVGAFSFDRLQEQWRHFRKTGRYLKPLRTQIWPYRLLVWQFIIIYVTSGWDKLQGVMWLDGTAAAAVFHHSHFVRFSPDILNGFVVFSPFISVYTLLFEFSWLLLLIPKGVTRFLPERIRKHSVKRWLILGGLAFHWGIFAFMDVGSFPFAMSVGYIGLLLDDDWAALKRMINRGWKQNIIVLYDGVCRLCQRSVFVLGLLDVLGRTKPVDFRDEALRAKFAPAIKEEDLDRAMHIKMPSGKYHKGFDAFRVLSQHLPVLLPLVPLLYLPGVAPVGRIIYAKVAENRDRCGNGVCKHKG